MYAFCAVCTASLSHLRTMLPESSLPNGPITQLSPYFTRKPGIGWQGTDSAHLSSIVPPAHLLMPPSQFLCCQELATHLLCSLVLPTMPDALGVGGEWNNNDNTAAAAPRAVAAGNVGIAATQGDRRGRCTDRIAVVARSLGPVA